MDAVTFKQLEALYWAAELGTFKAASDHLNTTQSAVAKRVRELELCLGISLFYRTSRSIVLTPRGEEVLGLAKELILLRRRIGEVAAGGAQTTRILRIGITDLTSMTWLAQWLQAIRAVDPEVTVLPQVDLSSRMFDDLINEKLQMIIVPDAFSDPRFEKLHLARVKNAWMASPRYTEHDFMALHEIAEETVITQTAASGTGRIFGSWLAANGFSLRRPMLSSHLGSIMSLAISGFGIAVLPVESQSEIRSSGRLNVIRSDRDLPAIDYVALFRRTDMAGATAILVDTVRETCDFSRPIWAPPT